MGGGPRGREGARQEQQKQKHGKQRKREAYSRACESAQWSVPDLSHRHLLVFILFHHRGSKVGRHVAEGVDSHVNLQRLQRVGGVCSSELPDIPQDCIRLSVRGAIHLKGGNRSEGGGGLELRPLLAGEAVILEVYAANDEGKADRLSSAPKSKVSAIE